MSHRCIRSIWRRVRERSIYRTHWRGSIRKLPVRSAGNTVFLQKACRLIPGIRETRISDDTSASPMRGRLIGILSLLTPVWRLWRMFDLVEYQINIGQSLHATSEYSGSSLRSSCDNDAMSCTGGGRAANLPKWTGDTLSQESSIDVGVEPGGPWVICRTRWEPLLITYIPALTIGAY